jgi:hypothetical protein
MLKYYAKLFVMAWIAFFLGALYANLNIMDGREAVTESIVIGAFVGLAVAGLVGTFHIRRARKIAGAEQGEDIYSLSQKRQLRLPMEADKAFTLLQHYFAEVAAFKMTGADKIAGTISGRTPFVYFRTMGNNVSAEVKPDGAGGSVVSIASAPIMPLALTDFGDNLRIVTELKKYLLGSANL